MQKVYSRINWENSPSTNTALGENNLNAMDYAIDEIDNRVVGLYGYESRAKESEENAKISETNAKSSETKAKEYMQNAFAGTPEGYDSLVDTVYKMDIKTSTDTTLYNSKAGGLRFNNIVGASVQDGTPTPDSPIAILNAFDCVEIMQGVYLYADGKLNSSLTQYVCTKNQIACKSGDVIRVKSEKEMIQCGVVYYNENGYLSNDYSRYDGQVRTDWEFTVPSGATHFNFNIKGASNITPSTVGKITLTINGKYVALVKTHGKNELNGVLKSATGKGVTINPTKNVQNTLEYFEIKGTATGDFAIALVTGINIKSGTYTLSLEHEGTNVATRIYIVADNFTSGNLQVPVGSNKGSRTFTVPNDVVNGTLYFWGASGTTFNNILKPMLRKADITDDTYEPYRESNARVLLNEPLRNSDVLYKKNGMWYVERNKASVTFDGSSDEGWFMGATATENYRACVNLPLVKSVSIASEIGNALCDSYPVISAHYLFSNTEGFATSTAKVVFVYDENYNTSDVTPWTSHLAENPMTVEYELATPTTETLDTESQIALNSLETFDGVTYIEFDSRVQPSEIEVEYGTSKVGGYTLKALLNSESNAIRYNELQVALVALESEV